MEVFVRNLPEQSTEKQVRKLFRPKLAPLDINVFHCYKPTGKAFAKITIHDPQKARRFLDLHGQTQPGGKGFDTVKHKIFHMRKPINCMQSRSPPDEFVVKSLEREEQGRNASHHHPTESSQAMARTQRRYDFSLLQCGSLDYDADDLGFVSHYQLSLAGSLTFGRHFVRVDLTNSDATLPRKQLQFPYHSVNSLIVGKSTSPYMTFTLSEAPRMFEQIPELTDVITSLGVFGLNIPAKPTAPKRQRITVLDSSHQTVVSNSLSYRFKLGPKDAQTVLASKNLSGKLDIVPWDVSAIAQDRMQIQMSRLNTALGTQDELFSFETKFQLQALAQNGYLPPYKVLELMETIKIEFHTVDHQTLAAAVRRLGLQVPFPGVGTESSELSLDTLQLRLVKNYSAIQEETAYSRDIVQQFEHLAMIHKATVTPAGTYLEGPEPEVKNRVLRKYSRFSNYFLQVTFTDEDGEPMRYDSTSSLTEIFHERFKKVLESSITIAGRPYEFLGFSHSSLRAQTCWFMAPFVTDGAVLHARLVIKNLGNFSAIRSPAKCAARIGQNFSQALCSVQIPSFAFRQIPEVERIDERGIKRTFSDGVGTCSAAILDRIHAAYAQSRRLKPTVCQIRYAGAKGMISLDERLEGEALCLRQSMIKFQADATQIEICGAGFRPLSMFLNRQLIKILEDLGVPSQAFVELQDEAVEQLRITSENPVNAGYYLQRNGIGKATRLSWLVHKLHYIGISFSDDGFLRDTLELSVLIQLRELKYRSRIYVERGFTAYGKLIYSSIVDFAKQKQGIMDETEFLKEGQIYCSVKNEKTGLILTGRVVITRCPALHPGDVQYVDAVDVPQDSPLRAVHNCVVFSSKGKRDLPSQLSGGDLDGDLYNIIYDDSLMPTKTTEPADYPTVTPIDIGREVARSDITDFFVQFMETDQLGRIATLHQTLADRSPDGVFNPECILLAEMHSTAVDFSKTGIPVDLTKLPRSPRERPDFQAPGPRVLLENAISIAEMEYGWNDESDYENDDNDMADSRPGIRYYSSNKVLGQLYRLIDERDFFTEIQRRSTPTRELQQMSVAEKVWDYVQVKAALIQYQHYLPFARDIKEAYEDNMIDTMVQYSFHPTSFVSEVEVFAGTLVGKDGAQTKRQRESSIGMKDKHDRDVTYTVQCILQGEEEDSSKAEALERSIACLYVGVHERRTRPRFGRLVSFTWVAAAVCLKEVEKFVNA
ncbi:MAG: hypothetical protein Q9228_004498 [Teloschistes exilis]